MIIAKSVGNCCWRLRHVSHEWRRKACLLTWEIQILWCLAPEGTPVPPVLQRNVIFGGCLLWLYKKYSGVKSPPHPDPEFRFSLSLEAWASHSWLMAGRLMREVLVDKLEVLQEFCYLADMLSVGRGCKMAAVTHCNCECSKFPVNLRIGVLNMLEKCDAACIKEMSHGNRHHETPMGKQVPHDSRTVLKALPGKLDIKRSRHSPNILYVSPNYAS